VTRVDPTQTPENRSAPQSGVPRPVQAGGLRVRGALGVHGHELLSGRCSLVVGLSLGNRYFSKDDRLKAYLAWATAHTKDRLAVVIPDELHEINLRFRNRGSSSSKTRRDTLEDAQRVLNRVRWALGLSQSNTLIESTSSSWADVCDCSPKARENFQILRGQFEEHRVADGSGIYAEVMGMVDTYLRGSGRRRLSLRQRERAKDPIKTTWWRLGSVCR